jgi:hypothetical protein
VVPHSYQTNKIFFGCFSTNVCYSKCQHFQQKRFCCKRVRKPKVAYVSRQGILTKISNFSLFENTLPWNTCNFCYRNSFSTKHFLLQRLRLRLTDICKTTFQKQFCWKTDLVVPPRFIFIFLVFRVTVCFSYWTNKKSFWNFFLRKYKIQVSAILLKRVYWKRVIVRNVTGPQICGVFIKKRDPKFEGLIPLSFYFASRIWVARQLRHQNTLVEAVCFKQ